MAEPQSSNTASELIHATAVAWDGRALLIRGKSGSGKSSLALQLMAWGAALVGDDRCIVSQTATGLDVTGHPTLKGRIEARGLGILKATVADRAKVVAIVDLDFAECERYPLRRSTVLLDRSVPLLHKIEAPHFPSALLQYLKAGRDDQDQT